MVGAVDKRSPPTSFDSDSIPVLAISCGLSLLLVVAFLRGFFAKFSCSPPSTKSDTSKFQFDLDVRASIDNSRHD